MQNKIETITEEKIEKQKKIEENSLLQQKKILPSKLKIEEKQNIFFNRVLPIKTLKLLSVPYPKLSCKNTKFQIPLIQTKEIIFSDILPPPKFKLKFYAESKLILPKIVNIEPLKLLSVPYPKLSCKNIKVQKPVIINITNPKIIMPPNICLKEKTQILNPLPLKNSSQKISTKEEIESKKEILDKENSGGSNDNLFTELFEWDFEPKSWERFETSINSKEPICIFLVGKDDMITAETTIIKLLSTEYKRKYGKIDASHELKDLSDSDKSIITFIPEQVEDYIEALKIKTSNINYIQDKNKNEEYNKFNRLFDDLMKQIDFTRGGEKKLIIFKCNSKSNISELRKEIKKKITSTHILKSKYSSLSETNLKKIIKQFCWILSIPSYEPQLIGDELDDIFTGLDDERLYCYNNLTYDEDWYKIKPSWSDEDSEHLKLKLLAYKQLKNLKFSDEEIRIEERFDDDGKEKYIPDLNVSGKIWVEIETLLGSSGPSYLIQEKFYKKQEQIMQHKEFWLVLPNFEIFMHKKEVNSLLVQLYKLFKEQVTVKIFGCDFIKPNLCIYKSQLKKMM